MGDDMVSAKSAPAGKAESFKLRTWPDRLARGWQHCLDLGLVLWVVRVPIGAIAFSYLVLGLTPQAQDLLVELADAQRPWQIPVFFVLLFLMWAMPTHYAARHLLDTDERFQAHKRARNSRFLNAAEVAVPRILGILPFVAMLMAVIRSYLNLPDIADEGVTSAIKSYLLWFVFYLVAGAVLFLAYTLWRRQLAGTSIMVSAQHQAARLEPALNRIAVEREGKPVSRSEAEAHDFGRTYLIAVFVIFLLSLLIGPNRMAEVFPRAMIVPFVFGGWVPLLSYLSGLGRRLRAPLLVAVALVIVAVTAILGDKHTVRRIDAAAAAGQPVDVSPIPMRQAVTTWMKANGCEDDPARCRRPIIVAAAGGASRAGFFTASTIGYFLTEENARAHGLDQNKVRNRLFAISAVSGSAVGAAMISAALAVAKPDGSHPCRPEGDRLWFGDKVNTWRDCLEVLMSGDFLTATFVGLAFHDVTRFPMTPDRATLLEEAWERHFAAMVPPPAGREASKCWGLSCPLMMLRPTEQQWIPLLVLNGTSVTSGRRIMTTPLAATYDVSDCPTNAQKEIPRHSCELFTQTKRFHSDLENEWEPEGFFAWLQAKLQLDSILGRVSNDIRISTAAHNSARFPLISPAGVVRNRKHEVVDRIVDGGYFENYGAVSATELANAVRAVEPKLKPFVLVISNDPGVPPEMEDEREFDARDAEFLSTVWSPIMAVANVRTARGTLAVEKLRAELRKLVPECAHSTAHVKVFRQTVEGLTGGERARAVSMSWWLSRPIQIFLRQQVDTETDSAKANREQLDRVWNALGDADCLPSL
jgi:hypothetical protein